MCPLYTRQWRQRWQARRGRQRLRKRKLASFYSFMTWKRVAPVTFWREIVASFAFLFRRHEPAVLREPDAWTAAQARRPVLNELHARLFKGILNSLQR
jgi:hypothetical protein